MIRIFVADDEELARNRLLKFLKEDPEIEVIWTSANGAEAASKLENLNPEAAFLDIDMPGKSGIEIALELAAEKEPPLVVFVTAHNEYAIKAFEAHAVDYILKPFDPARLKVALERIKKELALKKPGKQDLEALGNDLAAKSRRLVGRKANSRERILLDPADVLYFHAELAQVMAHLEGKEWLVNLTLEELEKSLDPARFARSHRAYIVNLGKVEKVVPMFNGNFELVLKDPAKTRIPLARRSAKGFRQKLGNW